jgi:hypothetical protein
MVGWGQHISVWWDALVHPENAGHLVLGIEERAGFNRFLVVGTIVLYGLYGLSMGLYRGALPAVISGFKLPFLYLFSVLICLPAIYLLNCLIGPRLAFTSCLRLLLMAVSVNAAALASYAPFSFFFTLTSSRAAYGFLVLMHVGVFGLAGIAGVVVIGVIFRATARELGKRLNPAMVLGWGALYAFVGTQTSWLLRPWIGTWNIPYTPFRPIEGSFIEAVVKLVFNLLGG